MSGPGSFYLNLPTTAIGASESFITALGLVKKEDWCYADKSLCFCYTDKTQIWYHDHSMYKKWIPKDVSMADTRATNACIVTLTVDSREAVDELIEKGIGAGGKRGPNMLEAVGANEEEMGMYSRSVLDPDGHLFEIIATTK